MTVKFSEKATALYGCKQLAEGVPVVNTAPTGTISVTANTLTVTGVGTSFLTEVAPNSYLYTKGGDLVGQVATVNSNTSITLAEKVALNAVVASETAMPAFGTKIVTHNDTEDFIRLNDHRFSTGDGIRFLQVTTIGTPALVINTTYYVRKRNNNSFQLYDTRAHAVDTANTTGFLDPDSGTSNGSGVIDRLIEGSFTLGLGPKNALPVLNLNFTTEFTTEAFQWSGDDLDRSEQTTVTDKYGMMDFETLMPSLGGAGTTSISTGTGNLVGNTGSRNLRQRFNSADNTNATIAAEVAVGDTIYTGNNTPVGIVSALLTTATVNVGTSTFTIVGHAFDDDSAVQFTAVASLTGIVANTTYLVVKVTDDTFTLKTEAGVAVTLGGTGTPTLRTVIQLVGNAAVSLKYNEPFRVGKSSSIPTDADLPMRDWFQTAGYGWIKGNGYATATNSVSSNSFLTIEARLSSPDLASENVQKTYLLTDGRGSFDLNVNIGKRATFKFNFAGNLANISDNLSLVPNFGTAKDDIADTVSDTSVTLSALTPYAAIVQVTPNTAGIGVGLTFIVDGLTIQANTTAITRAELVNLLDNAEIGDGATEIADRYLLVNGAALPAKYVISGKLNSYYIRKYSANTLNFYSPGQYGNLTNLTTTGTAAISTVTVISNMVEPPAGSTNNFCFEKLVANKINGFDFARYQLSCNSGWSRTAVPTDVTLTIIEDRANAIYKPDVNVEKNHRLDLYYGSAFNNKRVNLTLHKLQLGKYSPTTVATYRGQDLNFRNTGTVEIRFT